VISAANIVQIDQISGRDVILSGVILALGLIANVLHFKQVKNIAPDGRARPRSVLRFVLPIFTIFAAIIFIAMIWHACVNSH
jgi:hypothetical protein